MKTFLKYFLILGLVASSCSAAITSNQQQTVATFRDEQKKSILKKVLMGATALGGTALILALLSKSTTPNTQAFEASLDQCLRRNGSCLKSYQAQRAAPMAGLVFAVPLMVLGAGIGSAIGSGGLVAGALAGSFGGAVLIEKFADYLHCS